MFYAGGGDGNIYIGALNSKSDYATQFLGSVSDPRYFLFLTIFFSFVSILYNIISKLKQNAIVVLFFLLWDGFCMISFKIGIIACSSSWFKTSNDGVYGISYINEH